ncbi:enoyl-CoA hydratase-related protein [Euzebya rosea]|uniref:enoyl-CoA hydratase-related protein n=1 Tax=Euzebya rosea TaxID=2052804 RepID=UPI00196ABA9C|nr:enoyl-CoA hydratase-related protein [Euzebya rosea]
MTEPSTMVRTQPHDWYTEITLAVPRRRNALSLAMIEALARALEEVAASDAAGVLLTGEGPVFSSGHDFADMAGRSYADMRRLLRTCADMMTLVQQIPQVVLARVQGPALAAGCQLVASCDLAVAVDSATFSVPGGKAGWFCHTPMVAVGRQLPPKRALEMALTGDPVDASTAASWGLINRAVAAPHLDEACLDLLGRATRGSRLSKGLGKQTYYAQVGLEQRQAYDVAIEAMAASSQTADGQESMNSFIERRGATYTDR